MERVVGVGYLPPTSESLEYGWRVGTRIVARAVFGPSGVRSVSGVATAGLGPAAARIRAISSVRASMG